MCNPVIGTIEAVLYTTICVGTCLIGNFFQILSYAIYPFNKQLFNDINGFLASFVWKVLQFIFENIRHGKVTYSGDLLPYDESAIVLANHRSYIDFYLIHFVAMRKKQLPNLKYFLKDSLKFLPAFGWGMYFMKMIFVKRDWTSDKKKIEETFAQIKSLTTNVWIISYLEGSRITPEKVKASQEFSKKKGYPILENVLIPRTRGFIATLNTFREEKVKYIYDFTLVYGHEKRGYGVYPSMPRIFMGRIDNGYRFHIHVRRIPISSIPTEDEEITKWAVQLYKEKNDFLEEMKHNWTDNIDLIDPVMTPDDIKKDNSQEDLKNDNSQDDVKKEN